MRDPSRIPRIINLLERYWTQNPDLRLGQIVCNLTPTNHDRDWCDCGVRSGQFVFHSDNCSMFKPNTYSCEDELYEKSLLDLVACPCSVCGRTGVDLSFRPAPLQDVSKGWICGDCA